MRKIQRQREKERNREGESAKNNRRDGSEFDGKIMKLESNRDPKAKILITLWMDWW